MTTSKLVAITVAINVTIIITIIIGVMTSPALGLVILTGLMGAFALIGSTGSEIEVCEAVNNPINTYEETEEIDLLGYTPKELMDLVDLARSVPGIHVGIGFLTPIEG